MQPPSRPHPRRRPAALAGAPGAALRPGRVRVGLLAALVVAGLPGGTGGCADDGPGGSRIDPSVPKVRVQVWTEAIDPCSPQWVFDYMNHVHPAVGEIVAIERYLDGTANPDGTTWVFHGKNEFLANKYEACVQEASRAAGSPSAGHLESLQYTLCVNGPCHGPGGFLGLDFCDHTSELLWANGQERWEGCVGELGLDWAGIDACARSEVGDRLHWESSKVGNDLGVVFGLQGLPPVLLDGERVSRFWDCDSHVDRLAGLTADICAAYGGDVKPDACVATAVEP